MSLILCIESSTAVCSVALAKGGELISLRESNEGLNHSRNLALFVDEVLKTNNINAQNLQAIAISAGPGSYTGLRIGAALAKGLCYALKIPLIAIDSLLSLATVALEDYKAGILDIEEIDQRTLCPMIDARRMEVYTALFDAQLQKLTQTQAVVVDENTISVSFENKELLIFGDGAKKCEQLLGAGTKFVEVTASARGLVQHAHNAFRRGQFEDIAYYEPHYLKDFVATTPKCKKLG